MAGNFIPANTGREKQRFSHPDFKPDSDARGKDLPPALPNK